MEPKQLNISNLNNVLACDVFAIINFAPDKEKLPTFEEFERQVAEQVYYTEHKDQRLFFKLLDVALYKFKDVPLDITLLSTGMMADEWRQYWLKLHPNVHQDRGMAVYFYKKFSYT